MKRVRVEAENKPMTLFMYLQNKSNLTVKKPLSLIALPASYRIHSKRRHIKKRCIVNVEIVNVVLSLQLWKLETPIFPQLSH